MSNELDLKIYPAATLVSRGFVKGESPYRKFGASANIGTSATMINHSVVATVPHVELTAIPVEVLSANATDDSGNTGATSLFIEGVGENWQLQSETLTLNGTTVVRSTKNYHHVFRGYVSAVGTYMGSNAGNITIRANNAGTTYEVIATGLGQTLTTGYIVPLGYTFLAESVHMTVLSTQVISYTWWQVPNIDDTTTEFSGAKRVVQLYAGINGPADFDYTPQISFPEKTLIWFTGIKSGGTGSGSVEIIGTLSRNIVQPW